MRSIRQQQAHEGKLFLIYTYTIRNVTSAFKVYHRRVLKLLQRFHLKIVTTFKVKFGLKVATAVRIEQ
jgi:hypothetical protein